MTTLKLIPSKLSGTVRVPSSKSIGHRDIICSGLSPGVSVVDNIAISEDIKATNRCLAALGVIVEEVKSYYPNRTAFKYFTDHGLYVAEKVADCGESGSTLRFFIPLGALCNTPLTFTGSGKLGERPLQPYFDIFDQQNISYFTGTENNLPLCINGRLRPGTYELPGNVSSQFISGLLFALPLLEGDSELTVTPPVQSASYVELTLAALQKFGIRIERRNNHRLVIPGRQMYDGNGVATIVEGDWSQAAFWLAAGTLSGSVACQGLNVQSLQGDVIVKDILRLMRAELSIEPADLRKVLTNERSAMELDLSVLRANKAKTKGAVIDVEDCPDLAPILAVVGSVSAGDTFITNAERLRIKECDRLAAITQELTKLGASIDEYQDGLVIHGKPEGLKGGVTVDAWNDHRIAMSMAIASCVCQEPIILTGSESVKKSYPEFWHDFASLGGKYVM